MLTARDIMTQNVVTISPEAPIREAIDLLLHERISGLPVVDGDNRLAGIISEFALLAIAYDSRVMGQPVSEHMTMDVLSFELDDPIRKVADLFVVQRVRRAPVVNAGRLAGVISRCDVLRAVYENQSVSAAC
jgi:CBS domain-containing protein